MHVAICDDNVADRKQTERLLKRESEKRAAHKGTLYVDSYGNAESLLNNPMQYDVFFIDMTRGEVTGIDIVNSLISLGSSSPIVLCSSGINYREIELPERVLFLDKPIKTSELSDILDHVQSLTAVKDPSIELREEKQTHYVKEEDILYAIESGYLLTVTLVSGKEIVLPTTAANFFSQVESHISFLCPTLKTVINGRYIEKSRFRTITMKNGKSFQISRQCMKYVKYLADVLER